MAKLTKTCPYCFKNLELVKEQPIGTSTLQTYKCGHSLITGPKLAAGHSTLEFKSLSGTKEAFDYQKTGVEFIHESGFNALISDQMGLGKTIQSLLALRNSYETLTPCLILVKSATTWQWVREFKEWCSEDKLGVFVIEGTKSLIPPGFSTYILSMDSIGREGMVDKLLELEFKLCIVDEAHSFKNPSSKRSQSLMQFFKRINSVELVQEIPCTCAMCKYQWTEEIKIQSDELKRFVTHNTFCPSCNAQVYSRTYKERIDVPERICKTILLSGTPIVNRADEYFVPLNILAPDRFYSVDRFRKDWLEQDTSGKWSRIKPYMMDRFKETIAPFVLRRERKEVLKDLPPFQRTFTQIKMDGEEMKKLYNKEIEKLLAKQAGESRDLTYMDIQENIASMRQITGLAKVDYVTDYVTEFLEESEAEKICIGIHHKAVRENLKLSLENYHALTLSGEDTPLKKDQIVNDFKKPQNRVLIANTLAGGIGLNLQFCATALVVERQWSSAYEEQFEGRFNRPGQTLPVSCEYLIMLGTIDQYFHNLVEEKRAIFGETIENNWTPTSLNDSAAKFIDWSAANKLK